MRAILVATVGLAVGMTAWSQISAAEGARSRADARAPARPPLKAAAGEPANATVAAGATPARNKTETAVFAGGCFWCVEFAFEQLAGVIQVESGYCGGTRRSANYEEVHTGGTRHAEAVRVTYDPQKVTYDKLLQVFFDAHDPTQLNQQGEDDIGRQYRSAIFFANDQQKQQAEARIADLKARRVYRHRIVTKLEPLKEFYPAEDEHQDFARRHPDNSYIQSHAVPQAMQVRMKHPDLLRDRDGSPEVQNLRLRPGS